MKRMWLTTVLLSSMNNTTQQPHLWKLKRSTRMA